MKKLITMLMATIMMFALATTAWADVTWKEVETAAELDAALQTVKSLDAFGASTSYGSAAIEGNPNIKFTADITTSISLTVREETIFDMDDFKLILAENASIINLMDTDLTVYYAGDTETAITVATGEVYTAKSEPTSITYVTTGQELMDALYRDDDYIMLSNDITVTSENAKNEYGGVTYFSGTLDGQGNTLTLDVDTGGYLVFYPQMGMVFQDLDIVQLQDSYFLAYWVKVGCDTVFDNVDFISNEMYPINFENNYGLYINYCSGRMIMTGCDNNQELAGTGYNAIYVGGYIWSADANVTFYDCINYADYYGASVGMFTGNPWNMQLSALGTTAIYVSDCYNEGNIVGTSNAEVFGKGNGGSYDTYPVRFNEQFTAEDINRNGGVILCTSAYTTNFNVAVGTDGILTMVDTNTDAAETYIVNFFGYAGYYYPGAESLSNTLTSGPITTEMTLEEFNDMEVRYGWLLDRNTFEKSFPGVETYPALWGTAASGSYEDYEIAVVDGTLYYVQDMVTDERGGEYVLNTAPGRTTVYAYDETGKLIGSTSVSASIDNITVPDIEVLINDKAFFGTLEEAIKAAEDGDTVTIVADIEFPATNNSIDINKSLNIVGAEKEDGTKYKISNNTDETSGGTLFNIIADVDVSFDNLAIYVMNLGIEIESTGDGSSITVNNCYLTELANDHGRDIYFVRGDSSTDDVTNYYYDLTFTNNEVVNTSATNKMTPLHIKLGAENTLFIDGNTFSTLVTNNKETKMATIMVWQEGAEITITNNVLTDLGRAICVDHSIALGDWEISQNSFINVTAALNFDSSNDANVIDMSYNFNSATAAGEGTVVGLDDEQTTEDNSKITVYPYYMDAAMTKINFGTVEMNLGTSSTPYTTIVEGTEYFAEPVYELELQDGTSVDVTGEITYSYNGGEYVDYEAVIAAIAADETLDIDSTVVVTYSFAASGDYTGTVTGTITFAYAKEEVAYSVIGNTIYAKLGNTLLGTFYIAAPTELEYDGLAKEATIVDANSGILGSQTIVYTQNGVICDTPVDAGTYTASVTTQGLTASITFAISRVSVVFKVENNVFEEGKYETPVSYTNDKGLTEGTAYEVSYLDTDGNEVELNDETEVGTYTIVVTITNSNYKLSGTVGSVVVYEVVMPETYKLNYDVDGDVTLDSDEIATTVRTLTEEAPTKSGHTFAGWAYNGKIYTAGATFVQPEADVTMTATWIVDDMEVTGIVKDAAGNVISGATVTLVDSAENSVVITSTDDDGYYSFSGVAVGTYTISVSYTDGDGITYTSSSEVSIKADTTVNFSLQDLTLSTKVVVEAGLEAKTVSNLSEVAAEILSEQAENGAYSEFTEVEVSLIITSSNDLTAISEIADKTEDVGYTVDISIEKVFDNTVVEAVSETLNTIEIEIALPAEIQGMATYKVYRYHEGSVDILTTSDNDGEYIEPVTTPMTVVDEDGVESIVDVTTSLIIHAKYFSTYAIAATNTVASTGSVKKYSNSLEVGDNGSAYATPLSASSGTTVYINVTPDTGYEVDEVLVDGGDITVTDNEDGTYSYKQPAYAVEIEVTFVATDDVEEEVVEEETTEALTDFEDVVAGAWYEEYIAVAVEEGIMQGNSTTEFAPNGTTTRAMMIQVLFNMSDEPETENDEAAWYSEALAWGVEFGITDGSEITGNLTREQLVTMLYRYAMSNGVDTSAAGDLTTFGDAENVADWAADAFAWACGEGIINGDTNGNLNPDGNATRAELAKIMVSYLGL